MTTPLAYLGGRFVPFADAALSLHDAGFVSGATVVDNARTFRRRLFRWPDHLARLRCDCAACFVPLEESDEYLTAMADELVARNAALLPPGGELQLVTFATPGPLGVYLGDTMNGPPTLGMVTYPLPVARYRRFFTDGVTLAVVGDGPTAGSVLPPTVKHRSRMLWHVADHLARQLHPHAVAVLRDPTTGGLTETGVAHFVAVVNGTVVVPPRGSVLDGVSLRVTEELCAALGLPVREATILPDGLPDGCEAVLTGTGFGVAGVRELIAGPGRAVRFDWPGPVFRRLLAAWSDLVGVDIERQFTDAG